MVNENNRAVDVDLRVMPIGSRRASAGIKIHVGQTAFDGAVDEIKAAPVARGRIAAKVNPLGVGALGEDLAGAVDGDGRAGGNIDADARLDGEGDTVSHEQIAANVVRPAGGGPGGAGGQGARNGGRRRDLVPNVNIGARNLDVVAVERLD